MNMMVLVDKQWGIYKNMKPFVRIPEDLKLLREETEGKIVVMDTDMLDLLPGMQPLSKRKNFIFIKDNRKINNAENYYDLNKLTEDLSAYPEDEIFIIGGNTLYKYFLPMCNTVHVTYVDYIYEANEFFENLEESQDWKMEFISDEHTYFDLIYEFRMYKRQNI
jgi:Dihydrofolate reductase